MSATTGDLSDNHDVLSVKMYELDMPDDVSIRDVHLQKMSLLNYFRNEQKDYFYLLKFSDAVQRR